MEHQWYEIDRGKPTTRRNTCPSATLSTTNLTWTDPGSNPGLRGGRPATNRLSHGTTLAGIVWWSMCRPILYTLHAKANLYDVYLTTFLTADITLTSNARMGNVAYFRSCPCVPLDDVRITVTRTAICGPICELGTSPVRSSSAAT
jgi:hypothetical protein